MSYQNKIQELDAKANLEKHAEEDAQREASKKNENFYMTFKKTGSPKVRELIRKNPVAGELFLFLAEEADRTNAVVASGTTLATILKTSQPTISRAIKALKENDLVEILRSSGTYVFILNPDVVWSAWKTGKSYCMFSNAKVILSTKEQEPVIRKRLNVLLRQNKLPIDDTSSDIEFIETPSADD